MGLGGLFGVAGCSRPKLVLYPTNPKIRVAIKLTLIEVHKYTNIVLILYKNYVAFNEYVVKVCSCCTYEISC